MKFIRLLMIIGMLLQPGSAVFGTAAEPLPIIADTATGRPVTAADIAAACNGGGGVVFFGELHDSTPAHAAELALLQSLYARYGDRTVLSLEMFERDTQVLTDDFLAGRITEETFLERSRPWPNYDTAYRPLVMFAKEKKIPVIAANIPRRIAAAYAHGRKLSEIDEPDRQYLPRVHKDGSAAYKEKFALTLRNLKEGAMAVPEERIAPMFRAQCLKDNTMAESIGDYAAAHPSSLILHVQGAFHSEGGLGVPEKLRDLRPGIHILLVNCVEYDAASDDISRAVAAHRRDGDYLVFARRDT